MDLQTWAQKVKGSVVVVDEIAGGLEALALTVAARAATWVAALPTIALTTRTIQVVFALEGGLAWASAVSLELVGQAVVNAWLAAREWNAQKGKTDAAANERLLLAFCGVYFVADFLLVGVLEVPRALAGEWVHLTALLFPLMQVVSTVLMAERAAQYRRAAAAAAAKAERARQKQAARRSDSPRSERGQLTGQENGADRPGTGNGTGQNTPVDRSAADSLANLTAANRSRAAQRQAALTDLVSAFTENPQLSYAAAGQVVGRSKAWVVGAVTDLETAGVLRRDNGNGVVVLQETGDETRAD